MNRINKGKSSTRSLRDSIFLYQRTLFNNAETEIPEECRLQVTS